MSVPTVSGFISIDQARIYYETAGSGPPLIMIHAGVADNRQWNHEFSHFSETHRVLRYDMRGYGKSEPVEGEFSPLNDLVHLLDHLQIDEPLNLMGCSMGGGLALDFALENPSRVKSLILVGSGPSGLELDVEESALFSEAVKAFETGDLDQVAELETRIWFDGRDRSPDQVNQEMRSLLFEMNRLALEHEVKELGTRLPNSPDPAYQRLETLKIPVMIIIGAHDEEYISAAAEYMLEKIDRAEITIMDDAAHLPNMDHPQKFQSIVEDFLRKVSA